MCKVVKFGLLHNSFLLDIGRAIEKVPENFDSGFFLNLTVDKYLYTNRDNIESEKTDNLSIWLPKISSIIISGGKMIIEGIFSGNYYPHSENDFEYIEIDAKDVSMFELKYDDLVADYNGECIDAESGIVAAESKL